MVSYGATMYALDYWTHWTDSAGAYGGFLDYRFLGISTIFHVTNQNMQGQALFAFPDVTSYLLIALIILNLVAWGALREAHPEVTPRVVAEATIAIALICIPAYVWYDMSFIVGLLKNWANSPGGIFEYIFPFGGSVYHVTSGHLESMGVGWSLDFTLWLAFLIIIVNVMSPLFRDKRQD
jgi:hypothetical protein